MSNQEISTKKQIFSVIFLIFIIILTVFLYLREYSIQNLLNTLEDLNSNYLLAGLGMMLLFISCESINIYMIMSALNMPLPYNRCFQYSCIGFYFSSITPSASGGQPAQIYYMKHDYIPVSISTITIFFIVFVYQITMVFWAAIMSVFRYVTMFRFASKLKYLLLYGTIVNVGAILLLFSLMFSKNIMPKIFAFLINLGGKLRLIKRKEEMQIKLNTSMTLYREKAMILKGNPILFFKVFLVTIIQMTSLNIIPYLNYRSFGYKSSSVLDMFACQSLLTISTSAVPLPGAEGVAQGGFLQVFDIFFPASTITSAMLINRIVSFYIPLLLSFFVYFYVHLRTFNHKNRGDKIDRQ